MEIVAASPERAVIRKLEFYREGRSAKHPATIRAIRNVIDVDELVMVPWLERMELAAL